MSNVKISKINIKIGSKEIPLTLEEAKELQDILNVTFGNKEIIYIPNTPVVIPYPVYPSHYRYWNYTYGTANSTNIPDTLTLSLNKEA